MEERKGCVKLTENGVCVFAFLAAASGHEQHGQVHAEARSGDGPGAHAAQPGHVVAADGLHRQRRAKAARGAVAHRQPATGHRRPDWPARAQTQTRRRSVDSFI